MGVVKADVASSNTASHRRGDFRGREYELSDRVELGSISILQPTFSRVNYFDFIPSSSEENVVCF